MQRNLHWLRLLAPLIFFLALSLACFARTADWTSYYFGSWNDALLFIWFLHWWPFAIAHGLNPFICKYVWYPTGYNLAWATSVPFWALLSWPVTALGGPVLSYNILMLGAPALAAWTAYLLARELTRDWPASLICGALYGFSAPELYLMMNQLNLVSVFVIPLLILLCLRRMRGSLRRRPFVILFSFLLAAQIGMSTEVLAVLCVMGMLTWTVFLIFAPAPEREAYWRLAVDIMLCAPVAGILTAPFLYYLVQGLQDFPPHIHPAFLQQFDLLQFIVPDLPVRSGRDALAAIGREFAGFVPYKFACFSIPLLLMVALYIRRHIGRPYVRALAILLCLMALLSLGLKLQINGRLTNIPLPWTIFSYVPVLRSASPYRILTCLTLGTAVTAALWLAAAKTPAGRLRRFAVAGLACLCLPPANVRVLPQHWQIQPIFKPQTEFRWTRWPVQAFFTPAHITAALGPRANVILLPDPVIGPGMAWQLNARLNFTQANGYVGYTLVHEQKWNGVLHDIVLGPPKPGFAVEFQAFCAAHRVDYILIGPGAPPLITSAIEGLGWDHHMDDGIEVVKTPAGLF